MLNKVNTWQINQITQLLTNHMSQYGYTLVDLPIIEVADLFLIKAGDPIVDKLFTFDRHGRQLALRPEFTAAAAHQYVTEKISPSPVRWQFNGYIFEDDPEDVSSSYQRYSIGAELIGIHSAFADTEIIAIAAGGLNAIGLKDWKLIVGHTGLLRQLLAQFHLDDRTERFLLKHLSAVKTEGKFSILERIEKLMSVGEETDNEISVSDYQLVAEASAKQLVNVMLDSTYRDTTMGGRTRQDIARRLSQKRKRASEKPQILAALDMLVALEEISAPPAAAFSQLTDFLSAEDYESQHLLEQWQKMISDLEVYGIPVDQILIQPTLARLWDYYSSMVFELRSNNDVQLGGGGRYNGLARLVGGQADIPAVGFAYYVDQVLSVLPVLAETEPLPITIVLLDDKAARAATIWATQLRQRGFKVQLLPPDNDLTALTFSVDSQAKLYWQNRVYTLPDIENLSAVVLQSDQI
jgi:histidyl-tRNA synthetase